MTEAGWIRPAVRSLETPGLDDENGDHHQRTVLIYRPWNGAANKWLASKDLNIKRCKDKTRILLIKISLRNH